MLSTGSVKTIHGMTDLHQQVNIRRTCFMAQNPLAPGSARGGEPDWTIAARRTPPAEPGANGWDIVLSP